MYGAEMSAVSGSAVLAATGLAAGAWLLAVIGLVCVGVALVALVRRDSAARP